MLPRQLIGRERIEIKHDVKHGGLGNLHGHNNNYFQ